MQPLQTSLLALGQLQGQIHGRPARRLAVDGHQNIGKQTVAAARGEALFPPLPRLGAGGQLVGQHSVQQPLPQAGHDAARRGAEAGGQIIGRRLGPNLPA